MRTHHPLQFKGHPNGITSDVQKPFFKSKKPAASQFQASVPTLSK
jgi:hypothetical protein